jgi:hypothetical protein
MGLSRIVAYKRNDKLLAVTLVVLFVAVVNYYLNFDVLSPDIGNVSGSVKANMGSFFLIPVLVLTIIQLFYAAGILHLVTRSFYFEKRDFLKALFVASFLILLFSGFYTLVPHWGPYTFLTGSFRGVPPDTYALLAGWLAILLGTTTLLVWKVYGFRKGEIRPTILLLLISSMFLIVMAFAVG